MASYEKNKSSGLWSVRFRVTLPDGSTRQPRLSGYKTKKEAQYAYEDYLTEEKEKASSPSVIEETKPIELTITSTMKKHVSKHPPTTTLQKRSKVRSFPSLEISR